MSRLDEILRDPAYAGLHWSIPRDTEPELREAMHIGAARHAKWVRDRQRLRQHVGPYDPRGRVWLCCNVTDADMAMNRPYCRMQRIEPERQEP